MAILISVGIALSVGLMVVAIANIISIQPRPSRSRLGDLGLNGSMSRDAAARRSHVRRQVKDLLTYLGQKMEGPKRDWTPSRGRLIQAGYRQPLALTIFLGIRLAAAGILYFYGVVLGIAGGEFGLRAVLLGLVMAAIGWILPNFLLSVRITSRQKNIQRLLPDFVDLLVICVEAGLGLNQALQRVSAELGHASNILASEISLMNLEIRAGAPREEALIEMADRTGVADLRGLASMLVQTERFGTSIADSLRIHANTMRTQRQQRIEEEAAKTTIKMVFPLVLCVFPALLAVVLGPALIQLIGIFAIMGA